MPPDQKILFPVAFALSLVLSAASQSQLRVQQDQYNAESPKTILELQQFRHAHSAAVRSGSGQVGAATLVNLNPGVGAWYLLNISWGTGGHTSSWHLENPAPHDTLIALDEKFPRGLVISEKGKQYRCDLFGGADGLTILEQAQASQLPYYPICEGRLYLRNLGKGRRTALEASAEFLRTRVWGGEKVVDAFHHLMSDRYRETGQPADRGRPSMSASSLPGQPPPALIGSGDAGRLAIVPDNLGIALQAQGAPNSGMTAGAWYATAANSGIYVSIFRPGLTAGAILNSHGSAVNALDSTEASSLCYAVAFDLAHFELAYALGTDHPAVGWSDRVTPGMKDASLPGPDGIGTAAPLISTGMINPHDGPRTIAAFTGGFKRTHGAFLYGALATKNHGSHYGFIENGVVFSKLQAGLATVFALDDGTVEMKTWTEADNRLLDRIRYARQNGVPLVEFDDATHSTVPGSLVADWGKGNWSGSEDKKLRTIRAGLAIQRDGDRQFLIYAVFSAATPSAMARVFQAWRCRYAMLLDMNALEHTYFALYRRSGSKLLVDHLLKGMSELDKTSGDETIPRFLGFPDNRDFFYVMQRDAAEVRK